MKKPDFVGVARQTWKQMCRFPTSDALADAVLLQALFGLIMTPFSFKPPFPKEKWDGVFLVVKVFITPFWLLWRFNLPLRLRRNEKKAWRTAVITASLILLLGANSLFFRFLMRKGRRELNQEEREKMTEEQLISHQTLRAKLQDESQKPFLTPTQIVWYLITVGLACNVLFRAFEPATRARFRQ